MYEVGVERECEKTKNDEARMKESNLTHFIVVDGGTGCIQGRLYYKVFAEKGVKYPETYLQLCIMLFDRNSFSFVQFASL